MALKYKIEASSRRMVIGFFIMEAYGFFRAFEKSYSLRIFSPLWIEKRLRLGRFSCGNDSDYTIVGPVTMAHNQETQGAAETEQDEAVFSSGMAGVVNQSGALISEHGLGVVKAYAVLGFVRRSLLSIPLKA